MIKEFAIEPECLGEYKTLKFILDKFDVGKGLIIAQFPKKWKSKILSLYNGKEEMELQAVREILSKGEVQEGEPDTKIFPVDHRPYDSEKNWLEATVASHSLFPFAGIVVDKQPNGLTNDLPIHTTDNLWINSKPLEPFISHLVPHVRRALAEQFTPLLRLSKEFILIDPHFDPNVKEWQDILTRLVKAFALPGKIVNRLEIHMKAREGKDFGLHESQCHQELAHCVPIGNELKIFCWKDLAGGEKNHDRFLLTEYACIEIGHGFAPTGVESENAHFNISNHGRSEVWNHWRTAMCDDGKTFELVGNIIRVVGTASNT